MVGHPTLVLVDRRARIEQGHDGGTGIAVTCCSVLTVVSCRLAASAGQVGVGTPVALMTFVARASALPARYCISMNEPQVSLRRRASYCATASLASPAARARSRQRGGCRCAPVQSGDFVRSRIARPRPSGRPGPGAARRCAAMSGSSARSLAGRWARYTASASFHAPNAESDSPSRNWAGAMRVVLGAVASRCLSVSIASAVAPSCR